VEDHRCARCVCETTGAGEVIGLNVRLEDMGDPHGLLLGGLEVRFDIELWIHHSAASCAPSAEELAQPVFGDRKCRKIMGASFSVSGVVIPPSLL
jgi:hypothetical protein